MPFTLFIEKTQKNHFFLHIQPGNIFLNVKSKGKNRKGVNKINNEAYFSLTHSHIWRFWRLVAIFFLIAFENCLTQFLKYLRGMSEVSFK